MASQPSQDPSAPPHQNQTFVIFNRAFQEPKHEVIDGRYPPTYEQAMGLPIQPPSNRTDAFPEPSASQYSPWYLQSSTWANSAPQESNTDNRRDASQVVLPASSEPYLSATTVLSQR